MDLFFPTDSFWQLAFPQRRFPEHRIRAAQTRAHPHRSFAGSFPCSPSLPPSLWVAQCTLSTMVFPNTRTSLHQAYAVPFRITTSKGSLSSDERTKTPHRTLSTIPNSGVHRYATEFLRYSAATERLCHNNSQHISELFKRPPR